LRSSSRFDLSRRRARQLPLTGDRRYVPSERSGLPTIAIIGAINSRDVARMTGNSTAPVLAKDSYKREQTRFAGV
jgi:hypothetical protein